MKEIKGKLGEWRSISHPKSPYIDRLTTFEVNGKLHRNLMTHVGMTKALNELSGESTFFILGKEIFGIKNGEKIYKREKNSSKKASMLILLSVFLMIWPFLMFTLSADPTIQNSAGFGPKLFAVLAGSLSFLVGIQIVILGMERKLSAKAGEKLEALASKEKLKVIEI